MTHFYKEQARCQHIVMRVICFHLLTLVVCYTHGASLLQYSIVYDQTIATQPEKSIMYAGALIYAPVMLLQWGQGGPCPPPPPPPPPTCTSYVIVCPTRSVQDRHNKINDGHFLFSAHHWQRALPHGSTVSPYTFK